MHFKYAICAEGIIRDAENDRISAFNLIDDFASPGFPVLFPRLACVFVIGREEGDEDTAQGEFIGRFDETVFFQTPAQLDFKGRATQRNFLQLQGFVVPRPCRVTVSLNVGGEELGAWSFNAQALEGVGSAQQVTPGIAGPA